MSGAAFLVLLVWIVSGIAVSLDASQNSSGSAILWGLVAFLGGLLGVLLYVLLGRDGDTDDGRAREKSDRGTGKISHRCQSCGEKYYAPGSSIDTCRKCGGVKIDTLV